MSSLKRYASFMEENSDGSDTVAIEFRFDHPVNSETISNTEDSSNDNSESVVVGSSTISAESILEDWSDESDSCLFEDNTDENIVVSNLVSLSGDEFLNRENVDITTSGRYTGNELDAFDLQVQDFIETVIDTTYSREEYLQAVAGDVDDDLSNESAILNENREPILPGEILVSSWARQPLSDKQENVPMLIDLVDTQDTQTNTAEVDPLNVNNAPLIPLVTLDPGQLRKPLIDQQKNIHLSADLDSEKETQSNTTEGNNSIEVTDKASSLISSEDSVRELVPGKAAVHENVKSFDIEGNGGKVPDKCPLCFKNIVVPSKANFYRHILWHLYVKNSSCKKFAEPIVNEGYMLSSRMIDDKSFEQLRHECEQHLKFKNEVVCMLCFTNFEFHHNISQLMDYVDYSVPLKCLKCWEVFNDPISIDIHIRQHLGPKPFGCCICHEIFEDVTMLKIHMTSHVFHTYEKYFKCRHCHKLSFSEVENKVHESCHVSASNLWKYSPKPEIQEGQGPNMDRNKSVNSYFHSILSSVSDFSRNIISCGSAFELMTEVSKFVESEKTSFNEKILLDGELKALSSIIGFTKELSILLSEQLNSSCNSDVGHQLAYDVWEKGISAWEKGIMMAYNQVVSSSYRNILSDMCGHPFSDTRALFSHVENDHKTRSVFSCEDCLAEFDSMDSLFEHRNKHKELHIYKCPMCKTYFNFRFDITQHLKVHFANILKQCPECGLKYKLYSQLVQHLLSHIEILPFLYKCKECKKLFTGNDQLNNHKVREHSDTRFHECSYCGKRFFRHNVLLIHVKGHIRNKYRKSLKGMDLYKPCKPKKMKV